MKEWRPERPKEAEFIEGVHYYIEDGLMVLTERFLLERGYCCKSDCRHCPYPKDENKDQSKYSSSSL
jgi:hypothetical protein